MHFTYKTKMEEKYDDEGITSEQVEEYREMLIELGPHPVCAYFHMSV